MSKVALFVEGFAEVSLVRELILRSFDYTNVHVKCSLLEAGLLKTANYNFPADCELNSEHNFHIICCGGDAILSRVKDRIGYLIENNYTKLVGLRDIYSKEYRDLSGGKIDQNIITEMIAAHGVALSKISSGKEIDCQMCFSKMEIETWYLLMPNVFIQLSEDLNETQVRQLINIHGNPDDVENTVYHPALCMGTIFNHASMIYDKSQEISEKIANYPTRQDYRDLFESGRASHFAAFCSCAGIAP
jgi:hypothetical protein